MSRLASHTPDHETIVTLARQCGPELLQCAYRVLGDLSSAMDVQQEVFIRLLEKPPRSVESWPAFLTTIATRLAIDRLRTRQRRARLLKLVPIPMRPLTPDEQQAQSDHASALRDAIARLPTREATVFCLRHLSNLGIQAIAETMDLSENNVSVILHRAKKSLRHHLRNDQRVAMEEWT